MSDKGVSVEGESVYLGPEGDGPYYVSATEASEMIQRLTAERDRYRSALEQLANNQLSDANCATVELAGKRVRFFARAALTGDPHE